MIFSYQPVKTEGIYGTHIDVNKGEEGLYLGSVDGIHYIFFPTEGDIPEQHQDINFTAINTLHDDIKEQLKRQPYIKLYKEELRTKLHQEADIEDMLADCMKMIEFNMMLTARLAADYFGTDAMEANLKQEYATRNQAFLDSVDSGQLQIRGQFQDVNEMMTKLMQRYSHINNIVKENYIDRLKEIGF